MLGIFTISCSYIGGESTSNYLASGGKTIGYVENRPISSTIVGHGAVLGIGLILGPVLNAWAEKKMEKDYREDLRKLMFDCLYNKKNLTQEDIAYCRENALSRKTDVDGYFYALRFGKCQNEFLGLFKGFRKCWDEAFEHVKTYYMNCMPSIGEHKNREKELQEKYSYCKRKAEKEAQKALKEIEPKLKKYLN